MPTKQLFFHPTKTTHPTRERNCNCIDKENVNSTKNVSLNYEATLKEKIYFGKAEATFKLR